MDKAVSVLNRSIKDIDAVARSYNDLSDWSRSTLISFAEVLTPGPKEKKTALALQWKTVTDLFSDLLTTRLNVVQAMAMVMPMEGLSLLSMLDRAKNAIVAGLPPINEKVQAFEYDAKRFIDKVQQATAHHAPLEQLAAMSLATGASASVVKKSG